MKAKITNCLIGLDSLNGWYVPADIFFISPRAYFSPSQTALGCFTKFKVVVGVVKLSTFFLK